MVSLSKLPKLRNSTAALVIFMAWYLAASLSVVSLRGQLVDSVRLCALVLLTVIVFMTILFVLSRLLKRTDVVDAAWGPAFVIAALAAFTLNPYQVGFGWNVQTLVTLLVTIWAARLGLIITRRLLTQSEDKRYVELRKHWKGSVILNTYARVFLLQAILATLISSAVIHVNLSEATDISTWAIGGLVVWMIGFFFETASDYQLRRHIANPANKGKLMTGGLWKYTRHPNYFGEATMWWGIFLIALSTPYGWLTLVTPVIITYLLLFVSGVPMTEKSFEGRPGWADYKRRTSMFLPLPPKA